MNARDINTRIWQPELYLTFEAYRARPVADLLARIDIDGAAGDIDSVAGDICDLGCGAGNVTALLAERWPARTITGLDSSPAMIDAARKRGLSSVHWQLGDIAAWQPPSPPAPALIFSNAALHWVPDHKHLFPRLMQMLGPSGQLAVQMPNTADAPYRACLSEVLARAPWAIRLKDIATHPDPLRAGDYDALLRVHGQHTDIWESHYTHVLENLDAVVTWVSGAALTPYLSVLDANEKAAFLADYKDAAGKIYPLQADGKVLFTMRRLFVVARAAG